MRARRAALGVALAGCLAVAACGGGSDTERSAAPASGTGGEPIALPPTPTPQPLDYLAGAKAALASGAIAVVDDTNRVGIEPRRMDVNKEQRLSRLRWSGWGSPQATGRGEVRTLICDPDCAGGRLEYSKGVVVLSAPRRCGTRRFYTRSSMTYEEAGTGRTRAPATYLRTPPC